MIDDACKKQIVEKIMNSPDFSDSRKHQTLLQYLVEHTLKGTPIKETIIAMDLFGREADFDPMADPIVRVSIGNLRKKLDHYYLTTGKNDKIRLVIPKGHYQVRFEAVESVFNRLLHAVHIPYIVFIPIALFVLSMLAYLVTTNLTLKRGKMPSFSRHPIWYEFHESNASTLVIIGDFFLLYERKEGLDHGLFVRDPRLNSENDFKQQLKKNPDLIKNYVPADFTNISPSIAIGLLELSPILVSIPGKVELRLASTLKWEEIGHKNIIYIGTFKTLYILDKLLSNLNIEYQIMPPQISYTKPQSDTVHTFSAEWLQKSEYYRDYTVITKFLGPSKNLIMLLIGFDEMGVIEAVKTVAQPDIQKSIIGRHIAVEGARVPHFLLILEVEGIGRTAFTSSVKIFSGL